MFWFTLSCNLCAKFGYPTSSSSKMEKLYCMWSVLSCSLWSCFVWLGPLSQWFKKVIIATCCSLSVSFFYFLTTFYYSPTSLRTWTSEIWLAKVWYMSLLWTCFSVSALISLRVSCNFFKEIVHSILGPNIRIFNEDVLPWLILGLKSKLKWHPFRLKFNKNPPYLSIYA